MSAPGLSDAVARTRQRDLRRAAERHRLVLLARSGTVVRRTRLGRLVAAVVGHAAGDAARLFQTRPNRRVVVEPVPETEDQRAARFERDVLPHLDRLYSLALLLTGDPGNAEVLVEEAFTTAYASFHPSQPGAEARAWLYPILISTYRRRRPEPPPIATARLVGQPPADAEAQTGSGLGPAQTEALHWLPEPDIKQALYQLPEQVRITVYLADVEGYAYIEIAEIIGTPLPTVTAWLHQGRRQLRDRLREYATTSGLVRR